MSKKRLDRTVIEGGRTNSNKWEGSQSHKDFRARDRDFIKSVEHDTENWYDHDSEPTEKVYKNFNDKLGPMYRWLHSKVGQVWDAVRSEIAEKFDTRTTAGRHIVEDHLLRNVQETEEPQRYRYSTPPPDPNTSHYKNDFYVDDDGYLRAKIYLGRRAARPKVPSIDLNQLSNWLGGRVVGQVGNQLYWFTPTGAGPWVVKWGYYTHGYWYKSDYPLTFYYQRNDPVYKKNSVGQVINDDLGRAIIEGYESKWTATGLVPLKQYRKLNQKDLEYWNALPEHYRNGILSCSPTAPKPVKKSK